MSARFAHLLTDFNRGERLRTSTDGQSESLLGIDATRVSSGDYSTDPGRLTIQYEGGNATMRAARLSAPIDEPDNRMLDFELREPNVAAARGGRAIKGRVQMNAYDANALRARELYFATRLLLRHDFDLLRLFPKSINWLVISSWWNNAGWIDDRYPFKISVNIVKPSVGVLVPLRFRVYASVKDAGRDSWNRVIWDMTNHEVEVPIGRWVILEYYFREGDANTGQFYMAITPEGGARREVFRVDNWTQHPSDPAPDGLTHANPLKLYTSAEVIDHVRASGGYLQLSWDDLSFTVCRELSRRLTSACALRFLDGRGPTEAVLQRDAPEGAAAQEDTGEVAAIWY